MVPTNLQPTNLQQICTGMAAAQGRRLVSTKDAPNDGQETAKTLWATIWYKHDCICKHAKVVSWVIGVARIPGCRLRTSGICPIPCEYP